MKNLLASLLCCSALALPAAAKDILNVYTYDSFASDYGPGKAIETTFEKTCDCDVNYITLGDGVAVLNRLKLEGKATKADVVLGLDTNLTAEGEALGIFAEHKLDVTRAKVPGGWTDRYFMPFDYGYFAVVYDSEKMPHPPKSLDELVNGPSDQKIILQDPRASTPGLGFLLWMKQVYGEKSGQAWAKLRPHILTTAPSWDEAYALFTKGEAQMVFSYVTSPAYHEEIEKVTKYKAAEFAEGHYLQIEVAGRIAGSPQEVLAQKFLDFMLTPGFQDEIPATNWMMPAADVSKALPKAFENLIKPSKTFLFSPTEVHANRKLWIEEWQKSLQ